MVCTSQIIASARWSIFSKRPTIVPDLMSEIDIRLQRRASNGNLDTQDSIILRRCVEMLNKIFKEFYSFRMLTGVKTMKDVRKLSFRQRSAVCSDLRFSKPARAPLPLPDSILLWYYCWAIWKNFDSGVDRSAAIFRWHMHCSCYVQVLDENSSVVLGQV